MQDERDELLAVAAAEGRSISAMARVFLLRGMQADGRFKALDVPGKATAIIDQPQARG